MAQKCFEVQKLRIRHSESETGIFDAIKTDVVAVHDEVKKLLDKYASNIGYTMSAKSKYDSAGNPVIVVLVKFLTPISANEVNNILRKMYGEKISEISFRVQEKELVVDTL